MGDAAEKENMEMNEVSYIGDTKDQKANNLNGDADADSADILGPDEARRYIAVAARLNYLAVDRMDLQFAVKEAARAMSSPKSTHWQMLT